MRAIGISAVLALAGPGAAATAAAAAEQVAAAPERQCSIVRAPTRAGPTVREHRMGRNRAERGEGEERQPRGEETQKHSFVSRGTPPAAPPPPRSPQRPRAGAAGGVQEVPELRPKVALEWPPRAQPHSAPWRTSRAPPT